jgi:hypothetical protein
MAVSEHHVEVWAGSGQFEAKFTRWHDKKRILQSTGLQHQVSNPYDLEIGGAR